MRRSLTHFWRMNIAVVGGVAITTAVLSGALLVGDSMQGSLRDLTLDRLGRIHHVLLNDRFFPASLGEPLAEQPEVTAALDGLVPAILVRGTAVHADSRRRAGGVQILGVDGRFAGLFPDVPAAAVLDSDSRPQQIFAPAAVNQALLEELGARTGDDLLLSFGQPTDVPTASLMGRRDEADVLGSLRVTVTTVLPAAGMGRFSLEARQGRPLNVYLDLGTLQRRLNRPDQVNLLLGAGRSGQLAGQTEPGGLQAALTRTLELADIGLRLERTRGYVSLASRELILRPETVAKVEEVAAELDADAWPFLTYLANRITLGERVLPYSTVTALPLPAPAAVGSLVAISGQPVQPLREGEIVLSSWAAEDLSALPGDSLEIVYYVIGSDNRLRSDSSRFEVAAIVRQEGLAADADLAPEVAGMSDAENMRDWSPPFPVDLSLIRPRDEEYWDAYRGTPKAFVRLADGQQLWRSRYGEVTSIRVVPGSNRDLDALAAAIERDLPRRLGPESSGYLWLPVRAQGLRGASGTTDFSGLFTGFSLFLIVAGALLGGLLFTLLVEQRAREAGLLLALGFPLRRVRRRLLVEGAVLASAGAIAGTILAVAYAGLVLRGLETWWSPVLDEPFLRLHPRTDSLLLGAVLSIGLILVVITATVRRLSRIPVRRLLAADTAEGRAERSGRWSRRIAAAGLLLSVILLAVVWLAGGESTPWVFFVLGAALVVTGISLFSAWARAAGRGDRPITRLVVPRMAIRNSARNPGRSLLCVTLVACASFVLVSVTANRKTHHRTALALDSGTGGLALVAQADTPLPTPLGDALSPISQSLSDQAAAARFFSFRVRPGDDTSCLNLYRPENPRLLGVPKDFIERNGFRFRDALPGTDRPWTLLETELDDGAIPAIGDFNSVRWILHSGLGEELTVRDDRGRELRLRIVGLLDTSIFQSELLISETSFIRHFPDQDGYAYFLAELPAAEVTAVSDELEQQLAPYGLDASSTVERLTSYQSVENMYLRTFEMLGGLGLLLGTVGLGVVLYRNTLERRAELATLRAFGFRRAILARVVVVENAFLLIVGLMVGSAAGLVAVAPHLLSGSIAAPWMSLLSLLGAVLAIGLLASVTAVHASLRAALLPALKTE